MPRLAILAAVGAAALAGSVVPALPAAAHGGPRCGDTITHDVVLTHDLFCSGDGLVIGPSAGPTRVDLGGHTLHGSGSGVGISATAGSVAVSNGKIAGFATGVQVLLYGAGRVTSGSWIDRVRFLHDGTGLLAAGEEPVHVADSVFRDDDVGLHLADGIGYVQSSTFTGNSTGAQLDDSEARLSDDLFSANGTAIRAYRTGLQVRSSRFLHGGTGIESSSALGFPNILERNSFVGLGLGVRYSGPGGRIEVTGNSFIDNGASGLAVDHPAFPEPTKVTGNRFVHNGFAPGDYESSDGQPLRAGLWARNADSIAGNVAVGNAGYGIEAYDSVDGGGNVAVANNRGGQGQCLGVTCLQGGGPRR